MSIFSSALSIGKTALGFLSPAGSALKLAPWAIAGVLAVALYVEHERMVAADGDIKAAQAQTAEAVQKCQAEVEAETAAANAAAVKQQAQARAAASAAEVHLFSQRAAANTEAAQVQQALGQQLGAISTQAQQTGQDGPIPPVLAEMFP